MCEDSNDQVFQKFLSNLDVERAELQADVPHPTEKGRTLIKDTQYKLENYMKKKEKQTGLPLWNTKEVAGIKKSLRDEYGIKPERRPSSPVPVSADAVSKDTKTEEKFEPFYEGEGGAPTSDTAEPVVSNAE